MNKSSNIPCIARDEDIYAQKLSPAEYEVISSLSYAIYDDERMEYLTGIYGFDELLELAALDCHIPGTDLLDRHDGPKGMTCKECAFFDGNIKGRCRMIFALTGLQGKPFSSAAFACKHFEAS